MKKILKEFLPRLWGDERGQSTTEYILILSVVVMVALKFKDKFGKTMNQLTDKLDANLNKGLEE